MIKTNFEVSQDLLDYVDIVRCHKLTDEHCPYEIARSDDNERFVSAIGGEQANIKRTELVFYTFIKLFELSVEDLKSIEIKLGKCIAGKDELHRFSSFLLIPIVRYVIHHKSLSESQNQRLRDYIRGVISLNAGSKADDEVRVKMIIFKDKSKELVRIIKDCELANMERIEEKIENRGKGSIYEPIYQTDDYFLHFIERIMARGINWSKIAPSPNIAMFV